MKAHSLLITQRWLCLVLATATLAVVPCATAQEKEAPKELKSALVIVFGNAEKGEVSKVHRLTDAKQLAALEAFFPNYRSRPVGKGKPGFAAATSWYPEYEIYFNFEEGETACLEVALTGLYPRWRAAGRRDHELKGDFRKFVAGLKPHGKPLTEKRSETKELIAEREILRQRLEEIDKRLSELKLVGPFFVRMSEPYEVVQGEPGGPNVGLGNKETMRRDKFAYLLAHLYRMGEQNKPVPAFEAARHIFRTQPFRFEVQFPHEDAKQPPLRVQGLAKPEDYESSEMAGFARVPKEARLGEVEIKVSWPAFQGINQGSTTMNVFILPAGDARSTAQDKKDAKELISVLVVAFDDEHKVAKTYRLTDKKQHAALEAFFPNYRSRPTGGGNAWYPDYEVYFNFMDGETVRLEVTLKRTPPLWRAFGRGDHELKGDFQKFVGGLKPGGAWEGIR